MRSEGESFERANRAEQSGDGPSDIPVNSKPQWRLIKANANSIADKFIPVINELSKVIEQTIKEGESNARKNKV